MKTQLEHRQQACLPRFGQGSYQTGSADACPAEDGDDGPSAIRCGSTAMSALFSDVHVLIQAGGKGTRLQPATADLPKPMLAVGGMPMVERLLRALIAAGF